MQHIAIATQPTIALGAACENAILTLKELKQDLFRIRPYGAWKESGLKGHYKLPLYFDDGKTGVTRQTLVQFSGKSPYGLGFYPDDKEKKSATIEFDGEGKEVKALDLMLWSLGTVLMESEKDNLRKIFTPTDPSPTILLRPVLRTVNLKRLCKVSCLPGKIQLQTIDDELVCMDDFKKEPGDYEVVAEVNSMDAYNQNGTIVIGLVLFGHALRQTKQTISKPMEWRPRPAEEGDILSEVGSEGDLTKMLKRKKIEEEKQKKQENKKKKTKEVKTD